MTAAFTQPAAGWTRPPLEGPAGALATFAAATIKQAAAQSPRSVQASIGPSEIGTPCLRRLGYRILDWEPRPNSDTDPWPAMTGTAIHALLAGIFAEWNTGLGDAGPRFLVEHKITLPGGIPGTCDLYDRWTGQVIDWKTTGNDRLAKYRRDGPGDQYRIQGQLYGLGMQLAGEQPKEVAIVFLPRSGRLDSLHAWSQPYDPAAAVSALNRLQSVRAFHHTFDPERHPGRWALLPTADAHCAYCPWLLPGSSDLSQGCPGHTTATNPR